MLVLCVWVFGIGPCVEKTHYFERVYIASVLTFCIVPGREYLAHTRKQINTY